ncbi:MAG: 30S ribosomal protein S20 [Candidatus Omnitrophica bacterium]|jgi:small subunit ribosomal protein S20|nr:30S ribosomal protein S20 [Candidatus Omnitrophota bacterium]
MPKRRAAVKRLRVDKKRHQRNLIIKREIKKALKKFQALFLAKNLTEAKASLGKIYSLLDKAAQKKIMHPNTANRKKSRLASKVSKAA